MDNPTHYKGYKIEYVVNDVAPETKTAIVHLPDGSTATTSERVFRTRADWHRDIIGKIDEQLGDPKSIPEMPVSVVIDRVV